MTDRIVVGRCPNQGLGVKSATMPKQPGYMLRLVLSFQRSFGKGLVLSINADP